MPRSLTSTLPEEEFETVTESRPSSHSYDESPLDARVLDLDRDEDGESPFLRGQKRVPVRRGGLPREAAHRIKQLLIVLLVVGAAALLAIPVYRYATQSWRFRIDSSDNIEIRGNHNVTRTQILDTLGADIDRNIFFVSLREQKKQLEAIPWVESAWVMRLLPNQLRIDLHERTPVAFVEVNRRIALIDEKGVILDMPAGAQSSFSFPVIVNMSDSEPLSTRAARMKIYAELMKQLDSSGAHYSRNLSEVDVSDPDDVRVVAVSDPQRSVLLHLRSPSFLAPFQLYITHLQEWRSQFPRLDSLDLRYEGQVIVNPDSSAARAKQTLSPDNGVGGAMVPSPPPKNKNAPRKVKKR